MTIFTAALSRHLALFVKKKITTKIAMNAATRISDAYVVLACFVLGNTLTLFQSTLFGQAGLAIAVVLSLLLAIRWRVFLAGSAIVVGLWSASLQFHSHLDSVMPNNWERKDIELVAQVLGLPTSREQDINFKVRVVAQTQSPELDGLIGNKLQLSCYRCPLTIKPNEVWKLTVRLKRPHGYASKGAFDYEKYLFRHQIVGKGYLRLKSSNKKLGEGGVSAHLWRANIKEGINDVLHGTLNATLNSATNSPAEPSVWSSEISVGQSVITALSIGDKSGFNSGQREVLQNSGLSHLVAISGLHIGLVFFAVMFLSKHVFNVFPTLFERLPRPFLCLIPAIPAAIIYASLAGFAVSTQRALIMLLVFVVTKMLVRDVSLLKVLLIAACVVLLGDAFALLDPGFWLSCGAVAVIHFVSRNKRKVNLIKLQFALWLGMAPLTAVIFGKISLVSPLLNLIAVPVFCLVLIPATLLGVLLSEIGLSFLAQPVLLLLEYVYGVVFSLLEWLTTYSYTTVSILDVGSLGWVDLLLGLSLVMIFTPLRLRASVQITPIQVSSIRLLALTVCVLVVFLSVQSRADGFKPHSQRLTQRLKITLLDVGQGLSMVIQTAGFVTVYDTGPRYSSGFTAAEAVLLPYLRSEGISKIDRLIVSHADNDHIGGYDVLAKAFDIKKTLTSRTDKLPNASACKAGQQWRQGDARFTIVSPDSDTPKGSNNLSCVLKITHQGISFLITGDIEKQVERYLVKQGAELQADIMLVPHQGSKTSSTDAFLDAVKPELALVAAGYLNHYGHPHLNVLTRYRDRGIDVLSTVDAGSISVLIDNNQFQVDRYRRSSLRFWHWRD